MLILFAFCIACQGTESKPKTWFAPGFGIIIESPDSLVYFNTKAIKAEIWPYDKNEHAYQYVGDQFYNCKTLGDFYIATEISNNGDLELKSKAECFPSEIRQALFLKKMPLNAPLDFETLTVQIKIDGIWQEKQFLKSELLNIKKEQSTFEIEEQLWLIFNSKLNFVSKGVKPIVEMKLILNQNDGKLVKRIHSYPYPIYLRDMLDYIIKDFEGL